MFHCYLHCWGYLCPSYLCGENATERCPTAHLFLNPLRATSCWYLEIGHSGGIYTREMGTHYKSTLYLLLYWSSRLHIVMERMITVQSKHGKCVLSIVVTLWIAQKVEEIFFQYLEAINEFSKKVAYIMRNEWISDTWHRSLLLHFCLPC